MNITHIIAPLAITIPEVIVISPMPVKGLDSAPATNPDAPKMALAAPALLRSLSKAIAVSGGCIMPKHISV